MRVQLGATGGVVAGLVGLFIAGAVAQARQYSFVNLVDSSDGRFAQFNSPVLNDNGTIAFHALTQDFTGVFRTDGHALTTIARGFPVGPFGPLSDPGINNAGTVVFRGDDATGEGVYTSDGGTPVRIAHTSQGFVGMEGRSINDAGVVALDGVRPGFRNSGIFTGNGGPLTTVADTSSRFIDFASVPTINNAGTVAFRGDLAASGQGIFTGDGGPLTTVMMNNGGIGFNFPRINSAGTVAVRQAVTTTKFAILTGNGGPVTTVADSFGPYNDIGDPAINGAGTVAFWAQLDAGGDGVFTGPDPVADRVIVTGDPLFGSTYAALGGESAVSMNDSGAIAFNYALANGVQGIALAVPVVPEPTGAAALLAAALTVAGPALLRRGRRP